MPVFTTAVIAVSAAAAAGTFVSAVAAVAAVSMAVGVAGLAVTAVGLVTGNKGLLKAGKIMGYVGLAATVASLGANFAVEGFSEAMRTISQGVGGAYSSAGESLSNFFSGGAPDAAAGLTPANYGASVSNVEVPPLGTQGGDAIANVQVPPPGTQGGDAIVVGSADANVTGGGTDGGAISSEGKAMTVKYAGSQPSPVVYHNDTTGVDIRADGTMTDEAGKLIPSNVVSADMNGRGVLLNNSTDYANIKPNALDPLGFYGGDMGGRGVLAPGIDPTPTAAGMPDWMKYAAVTGTMQAGGGLLSGYLAGATAEEKLNFEKLKNEQDQAQRTNISNVRSAYAPQIQFQGGGPVIVPRPPAGLINA